LSDDLEGPNTFFGPGGAGFVPGAGVFVVGDKFAGGPGWRVRRSVTGEPGTWSTVDGPIPGGIASGVASDSQGRIYVVGSLFVQTGTVKNKGQVTATGYSAWAIRRSDDGGVTWSTADIFNHGGTQSAKAHGIGKDAAGNVVVVGSATDAQGKGRWIVRSLDSAGVWRTIDDFLLPGGMSAVAGGATTDSAGNLLVVGNATDATGTSWVVRKLIP
jgi:hypothetical protein